MSRTSARQLSRHDIFRFLVVPKAEESRVSQFVFRVHSVKAICATTLACTQ